MENKKGNNHWLYFSLIALLSLIIFDYKVSSNHYQEVTDSNTISTTCAVECDAIDSFGLELRQIKERILYLEKELNP